MVTDEERREVAKKLRNSDHIVGFNNMLRTRFLSLIRAANELGLEHEGSYLTMDGVNRLAELIDRPTTSNVQQADRSGHAPLGFTCELCGAQWPMDLGFVHCPECGAEVVSDE